MSGLYVHVPFCKSKCPYCDFYSGPFLNKADAYLEAVVGELALRRDELTEPVTTVYVGGGTPSLLTHGQLSRLIDGLRGGIDLSEVGEMTIEANPEDVTSEWTEAVKALGFNRVSIGVQSFDDDELRAVNRRHDAATAERAIGILRDGGIREISADLIYGLPLQTLESWKSSLRRLLDLRVPHFSAYSLSFEPGTRLYAMRQNGKVEEADETMVERMYAALVAMAGEAGYEHYEISNFCLPGHRSRHNSSYWNLTPYLGLGPAAHSFDGITRSYNPANINEYVKCLSEGKLAVRIEEEEESDRFNDYVITALRTADGVDLGLLADRFSGELCRRFLSQADPLIADERLTASGGRLAISRSEVLRSDSIMREMMV